MPGLSSAVASDLSDEGTDSQILGEATELSIKSERASSRNGGLSTRKLEKQERKIKRRYRRDIDVIKNAYFERDRQVPGSKNFPYYRS